MKKILIITLMATLILLYDKIDALSLDGTPRYQQQYHNSQLLLLDSYDTYHTIDVNFNIPFSSNANYAIFSILGLQWYSEEDGAYGNPDDPTIYRDVVLKQYLNIQLKTNGGAWAPCEIQDSYLVCTINSYTTYTGISVQADSLAITQGYSMLLNNYVWFYDKDNKSVENAINSQTQQQQQNYDGFMNSNQTYTDQQDTNMRGVNETMEFEQAESQLIDSLDMNASIIDEIIINPEASVFIWNIVEVLRSMNPAIILLMGSMLGMGILKLVLNR